MIEFDVECWSCRKLITLRVHDEQSRLYFEQHGALCEACHERAVQPRVRPVRRLACS